MDEFISRSYGKEGYEIIIKTDSHEHYKAAEELARRLIDHTKPMSNADRIRSMGDEELAVWLTSIRLDMITMLCKKFYMKIEIPVPTVENTAELREWLQQPAENPNEV